MTDFGSVENLAVYRDDDHVANLRRLPKGCEFRYTEAFLNSNQQKIALHLPKKTEGLTVEGIANLPTYFAGLLPEGVMYSAVRQLIGSAPDDLFAILAATGADAIGDIEVRVPGEKQREPTLNLAQAARQIQLLLGGSSGFSVDHLAAISGIQPKMSLGEIVRSSRTSSYIAKFDSPEFPNLIPNEFAFTRLARLCRIEVAEAQVRSGALVTSRFDRIFNQYTSRMQRVHVEDMVQVMDQFPNSKYSMEFSDLLNAMAQLGVSKSTLLDTLKLYVFSYIIGNGDLHAKNVSVIYDKPDQQWRLSPAYDLLSTLPYRIVLPGAERMALALIDEIYGRFLAQDFVAFGALFELPERAVLRMVNQLASTVLIHLHRALDGYISPDIIEIIAGRAKTLIGTASH